MASAGVLTIEAIGNVPVADCADTQAQCTAVALVTAGAASKLTVGGKPVATSSLAGKTTPGGSALTVVDAKNTRLVAE